MLSPECEICGASYDPEADGTVCQQYVPEATDDEILEGTAVRCGGKVSLEPVALRLQHERDDAFAMAAQSAQLLDRLIGEDVAFIYPNLNDTFAYACADTERLTACEELIGAYAEHGWRIFAALAAFKRGKEPLPQIADTTEYRAARARVETDRDLRIMCEIEQPTDEDFARWKAEEDGGKT